MTDTYFPPRSAGGISADAAAGLRAIMSETNTGWLQMMDETPTSSYADSGPDLPIITLTVRRWAAPAPWTGSPFRYEWKVAVSDADPGRWVSGDVGPRWPIAADTPE